MLKELCKQEPGHKEPFSEALKGKLGNILLTWDSTVNIICKTNSEILRVSIVCSAGPCWTVNMAAVIHQDPVARAARCGFFLP